MNPARGLRGLRVFRVLRVVHVLASTGGLFAVACSMSLDAEMAARYEAPEGGRGATDGAPTAVAVPPSTSDGGQASGRDAADALAPTSPLCGSLFDGSRSCSPDDAHAVTCAPGTATGGSGSGGDAGAEDAGLGADTGSGTAGGTAGGGDSVDAGDTKDDSPTGADGGSAATRACRVRGSSVSRRTTCEPVGTRGEGNACLRSSDCGVGLECVGAPSVCRRYCCDLECGPNAFCGLERTAKTAEAPNLVVPVCRAPRPCTLLGDSCSKGETCTVVTVASSGATSCVTVGNAAVGEDCEREACGADLTCLGQAGNRRCYQLCRLDDASACPSARICRGSPQLFTQENVGVCD